MKKTPKEGDMVDVCEYDQSPKGTWRVAEVISALSAQFTYSVGGQGHDFMLYNSTDWRFPNAESN